MDTVVKNVQMKPQDIIHYRQKFLLKDQKKIHGDRYDYSLVDYVGIHQNIKIICSKHGIFQQLPNNHLKGLGCAKCSNIKRKTKEEFIVNSNDVHENKYDYSLAEYKNNRTKVKIICPIHGVFEQCPDAHINQNQGCPKCKRSKGEEYVEKFLIKNNINFITQKTFDRCIDVIKLHFDFYLPDYNICIEYDGKQHYHVVQRFGGENGFIDRVKKDKIKNDYCTANNIELFRIRYNDVIYDKLILIYKTIKINKLKC